MNSYDIFILYLHVESSTFRMLILHCIEDNYASIAVSIQRGYATFRIGRGGQCYHVTCKSCLNLIHVKSAVAVVNRVYNCPIPFLQMHSWHFIAVMCKIVTNYMDRVIAKCGIKYAIPSVIVHEECRGMRSGFVVV